jgi:hypothetical protein
MKLMKRIKRGVLQHADVLFEVRGRRLRFQGIRVAPAARLLYEHVPRPPRADGQRRVIAREGHHAVDLKQAERLPAQREVE